ncbi:MAG: acylneuraminate cytidylyltransferase family protein [Thermodesulfobacteriota bacterium]
MTQTTSNSTPKIVALVPMRHHSERVPGKNYRFFAGKPLYHYIVNSLLSSPFVAKILIDTDSTIIREDVDKHFPQVATINRPAHLTAGTTPMNNVLLHDVQQIDADYYIQTHSTNPLLRTNTISRAIQTFLDNSNTHDSLFSVTRMMVRLWDQKGRPINHDPSILLRTQDLPPVYEENSCIYIFSRDSLEQRKNRIGAKPFIFEIETLEAWDIDEEPDFYIAEFLYKKYFSVKGEQ